MSKKSDHLDHLGMSCEGFQKRPIFNRSYFEMLQQKMIKISFFSARTCKKHCQNRIEFLQLGWIFDPELEKWGQRFNNPRPTILSRYCILYSLHSVYVRLPCRDERHSKSKRRNGRKLPHLRRAFPVQRVRQNDHSIGYQRDHLLQVVSSQILQKYKQIL